MSPYRFGGEVGGEVEVCFWARGVIGGVDAVALKRGVEGDEWVESEECRLGERGRDDDVS